MRVTETMTQQVLSLPRHTDWICLQGSGLRSLRVEGGAGVLLAPGFHTQHHKDDTKKDQLLGLRTVPLRSRERKEGELSAGLRRVQLPRGVCE